MRSGAGLMEKEITSTRGIQYGLPISPIVCSTEKQGEIGTRRDMKGPDRKYQEVVKIHQQIGLVVIRIVLEPSQVTAHSLSHFMQSAIYTFKL